MLQAYKKGEGIVLLRLCLVVPALLAAAGDSLGAVLGVAAADCAGAACGCGDAGAGPSWSEPCCCEATPAPLPVERPQEAATAPEKRPHEVAASPCVPIRTQPPATADAPAASWAQPPPGAFGAIYLLHRCLRL